MTNPNPIGFLSPSVLQPNITPSQISAASASAGAPGANVYSLTNNFNVQGVGIDMTPGHTVGVLFEVRTVVAADQTFVSYCDSAHGWLLDYNSTGDTRMLFKGAGTPALPTAGVVYPGLHCIFVTRTNAGALRSCIDGRGVVPLHANPTYVSGIGTTDNFIGRVASSVSASGFVASGTGILEYAGWNSEFTDAQLIAASGCVANLNRYQFDSTTLAIANLLFQWKVDRDYNPANGTTTAGAGSGPITWTKNGSITKNVIEQEYRYTKSRSLLRNSYIKQPTNSQATPSVPYIWSEAYARTVFRSECTKLVLDVINDTAGFANMDNNGIFVNGASQGSGARVDTYLVDTTSDYYGLAGGAGQEVTVTEGIQSSISAGGVRRAITVNGFRVPISTPITEFLSPKVPAKRVVQVGDSITIGQSVTSGTNLNPAYQSWSQIMRVNGAAVFDVINNAYGFGAYHDFCTSPGAIAAKVAQILAECDGYTDNLIIIALGTNDYGLNEWSAAAFQTGIANFYDALKTGVLDVVPNGKLMVVTPTTRLNENVPNGSGSTLPDYRTGIYTTAGTRPWMVVADGTTFVTYPTNIDAGGLHPTTVGQAQYATNTQSFVNANYPAFIY